MKPTKTKYKPDEFVAAVGRALRRSARTARKVAKMHGTLVYISKDGKVVGVKP